MKKTAPCYSATNYYKFFDIDTSGKKILDIGSSIGSFKKSKSFNMQLAKLKGSEKYITIDIDPKSGADIIADAHSLPFKNNEFDIIIANNVIEHFYDPPKAIAEIYRVLKKGGYVYFTVPFLYPIHEAPHDYVRFTRFGLTKLFEDFEDFENFSRGGFFSTNANMTYKLSYAFDKVKIGNLVRLILYPFLWAWVQLDRLDNSEAFTRVYFGKAKK